MDEQTRAPSWEVSFAGSIQAVGPLKTSRRRSMVLLVLEACREAGLAGSMAQSGGQAWWAAQSRSGTTPACSWRMEPTLSRCMIWWELPQ